MSREEITGIVLCGGQGSRMGTDKGLINLGPSKLVEIALEILRPVCHTLLLSTNNPAYEAFGVPVVPDLMPGRGPMAGIYSCLVHSDNKHHYVLSVDTPLVPSSLLPWLMEQREDAWVAVPMEREGAYEPLVGYYNRKVLPFMKEHIESQRFRLPDLFKEVPFKGIDVKTLFARYHPHIFRNLNHPEDLAGITAWMQQK